MPRSKRARVVHTSKVTKNRKERVSNLLANVQAAVEAYDSIWVFDVQNMRNNFLKEIRSELSDSRMFMGKNRVLALALGAPSSSSTANSTSTSSPPAAVPPPGTQDLAPYLSGEVGLLFTSRPRHKITSFFADHVNADYARAGSTAARDFRIRPGELYTCFEVEGGEDDPLPLQVEPQLRKLGVPTRVSGGKVVLEGPGTGSRTGEREMNGNGSGATDAGEEMDGVDVEEGEEEGGYVVCREGDVLDSRQTHILKIFGVRMAEFRVRLRAVWTRETGKVEELDPAEASNGRGEMDVDDDGTDDANEASS